MPAPPETDEPVMVKGEHNPFANMLLAHARRLDDERTALMEQIAANRDGLRSLRVQGLMSPDQATAVEEFYPTRTRKADSNGDGGSTTPDAPVSPDTPAAA